MICVVVGQSCKNAAVLANKKRISMERKYDGGEHFCRANIRITWRQELIRDFNRVLSNTY